MVNHVDGISVRDGVISRGDPFLLLYAGFQRGVAAIAHTGVNVLIDEVTLEGAVDQGRWNDALHGLEVCWVGLRCSPDVVAEREARRKSRLPGIARHQAESVHTGMRYDLEVDTERLDLREEMNVIADWLGHTWSIDVSRASAPHSTLPATSAWIQGAAVPAPWEH
jgi:chloramphenicol 3-O phosphotransferase